MKFIKKRIFEFITDARGVTLVEYGIALTLAVTFGVVALMALGGDVDGAINAASTQMPG